MAAPGDKSLTLTIHGLEHMGTAVYADVVSKQFHALVRGLEIIDKELNGKGGQHEFVIADMHIGSAVLAIRELPARKASAQSPSKALATIGRQIMLGSAEPSSVIPAVSKIFHQLSDDVAGRFRYSTLDGERGKQNVVLIDKFFRARLEKIEAQRRAEMERAAPKFFVGHAYGAFQGRIEEFDIRQLSESLLPAGHFILTAGNKDIDCLFYADVEDVKAAFGREVVVEGNAIYDGMTGMPARIEISTIKPVEGGSFIERRGSIPPYESSEEAE
jgi:hypothetical protein